MSPRIDRPRAGPSSPPTRGRRWRRRCRPIGGGASPHAARIVDALAHLPAGARFPWLARRYAVEELVLAAVARRDWPAAARAARLGQGRLVSLLALVAAAARGGEAPASALWIRWLLAPMRLTMLPLVRVLARRDRVAGQRAGIAPVPAAPVGRRRRGMSRCWKRRRGTRRSAPRM